MKNRKLLLIVSLVLAMTMSLGGTLAYLTDTDADVNTMVLGNVQIVQNEQEWNADKNALKDFTPDKPLLPYVGTLGWENKEDQDGAYRRFTMSNVVDKYVTVTNKGNTDAYVRTIIAVEMGGYTTEAEYRNKIVGFSRNVLDGDEFKFEGAWEWDPFYVATIDSQNYLIMTATHKNPVAAKTTTIPSLLQVYVNKDCDNEQLIKLDGNKNGKLDILVISQAVQANGFENASAALNEAFSYGTDKAVTVAGWFESIGEPNSKYQIGSPNTEPETGKNDTNNPPSFEAASADELLALLEKGSNATLVKGVDYGTVSIEGELNNVTITGAEDANVRFNIMSTAVLNNVTFTKLDIEHTETTANYVDGGAINIKNGATVKNLVIEDSTFKPTGGRAVTIGIGDVNAEVTIRNCTIQGGKYVAYRPSSPIKVFNLLNNDISDVSSWVVQFNGDDVIGSQITISGNTITNCKSGMAKKLSGNHADASFVFTNNILSNCAGKNGSDLWFENLGKTGTLTVSGNTLNGVEFVPGAAQGLGN